MAAGGASFVKTSRIQGFFSLLTSAACEWFFIFLLLVDAALSYLLAKFASYCQLQPPCLFCSRLDPILGGGKQRPEFYQNLFCSNHRSEISSLISCHMHGKVADGNRMCDDCLLSFNTNTKPNLKTHRLLAGKLGLDIGGSGFQRSLLSRDLFAGSKGSRPCACCGKLWKSGHNASRSFQLKSPGRSVLKPCIPLPHVPRQSRLNLRDNLKKTRDNISGSVTSHSLGKSSCHPSSPVGYSELRLTSDSESEFPFSDDDDVGSVCHENMEAGNIPQFTSVTPPKCIPSDSNAAKPNISSPNSKPLLLYPCAEPNIGKHHDVKVLGSDAVNDDGLDEINLQQANQKSSSSDLPELISLDEVSPSPIVVNISSGESEDSKITSCLSQNSLLAPLSELMILDSTHAGASPEKSVDVRQASGTELISEKHEKVSDKIGTREKSSIETDLMVSESAPRTPRQGNSSNMSQFPVTTKEREVPGLVIEQPNTEEVYEVREELKLSPSNNSSPHGSNMSSVVSLNHVYQPKTQADASSSNGIETLQKSASVESGLESLYGSNVTEIEGESIVDQLKRQIEYDKKRMNALYKELEEERNASEIATNEAMAMITRLQEEKAALQMEALQYLRMMEEQAEYDGDELEKVNDLLAEREKDIQDLEAELECYRLNLTESPTVQNMHKESCDLKGKNVTVQNVSVPNITNTVNDFSNSNISETSKVSDEAVAGEILSLEFEEEKLYISQCLKSLEKKLHQISCNVISSYMPNGRLEKFEGSKSNQHGSSNGEGPQSVGQIEETDLSIRKNVNTSNGSLADKDGLVASDGDDCSLSKENNHSRSAGPKSSLPRREVDLVALENEIADLNDRLEALEADHGLLEHIMNSLRNGNDGIQFIEGIAHQLHELRKIVIRSRW